MRIDLADGVDRMVMELDETFTLTTVTNENGEGVSLFFWSKEKDVKETIVDLDATITWGCGTKRDTEEFRVTYFSGDNYGNHDDVHGLCFCFIEEKLPVSILVDIRMTPLFHRTIK